MAKGSNLGVRQLLVFPDTVTAIISTGANASYPVAVPSGANYAVFSGNADFWVNYGTTVGAIPTLTSYASTMLSTNAELNPTARNLGSSNDCSKLAIISASTAFVGSISWYLPN